MRPKSCRFLETHEWCRMDGDLAVIGITDFAAEELTDITHVEVSVRVGAKVKKGAKFGEIESVKAFSDLYSPVSGTVREVNAKLANDENAKLVNESPFDQGWMMKLKLDDPKELEALLTLEQYEAQL